MAEVSPASRVDPASRTVSQTAPNTPNRTAISVSFQGLLRSPSKGSIPALRPAPGRAQWSHLETTSPTRPARAHPPRRRDDETEPGGVGPGPRHPGVTLDPLCCQMAAHSGITPMVGQPSLAQAPSAALPLREDLQNLIAGLARRIAWGGDRRKGSARIELSEGSLAGATLVVHTEQRSVCVELELPAGGGAAADWQQRILERLEGRGFSAQVRIV
jgi:hypothetical protein